MAMIFSENPNQPYLEEIARLKSIYACGLKTFHLPHLSPALLDLYIEYSIFDNPGISDRERILLFLNYIRKLSIKAPSSAVLNKSPLLNDWCAVSNSDVVLLFGVVNNHPHLRETARARTSLLFQVWPKQGWARTWNRFYRLGTYSKRTFSNWQREGKIGQTMQLLEFDDTHCSRNIISLQRSKSK